MTLSVEQIVGRNMLETAWRGVRNNKGLDWSESVKKAQAGIRESIDGGRIAFSSVSTDMGIQGDVHATVHTLFGNATERMSHLSFTNLPWHERYNNVILTLVGIGSLNRKKSSEDYFALSKLTIDEDDKSSLIAQQSRAYLGSAIHGLGYWFMEGNGMLEGQFKSDVEHEAARVVDDFYKQGYSITHPEHFENASRELHQRVMAKLRDYPTRFTYITQDSINGRDQYTEHMQLGYNLALLSAWAAYQPFLDYEKQSFE